TALPEKVPRKGTCTWAEPLPARAEPVASAAARAATSAPEIQNLFTLTPFTSSRAGAQPGIKPSSFELPQRWQAAGGAPSARLLKPGCGFSVMRSRVRAPRFARPARAVPRRSRCPDAPCKRPFSATPSTRPSWLDPKGAGMKRILAAAVGSGGGAGILFAASAAGQANPPAWPAGGAAQVFIWADTVTADTGKQENFFSQGSKVVFRSYAVDLKTKKVITPTQAQYFYVKIPNQ